MNWVAHNALLQRLAPYVYLVTGLIAFGAALRYWALPSLYWLCDDSSMTVGARDAVEQQGAWGLLRLFVNHWGPNMIRPFQWIGMHLEHNVLALPYGASVMIGVALMALAAGALAWGLQRYIGWLGIAIAGALMATGVPSSEPMTWLSDRHDVYFAVFFCTAIAAAIRTVDTRLNPRTGMVVLVACLVGAFYSNERGAAAPAVVSACTIAFVLARRDFSPATLRRTGAIVGLCLAVTAAYFLLRTAVIGNPIGGYDSRITPSDGLTIAHVGYLLRNALTMPLFAQVDTAPIMIIVLALACTVAAAMFAPLILRQERRWALLLAMAALYGAVIMAALPTLRSYIFPAGSHWELGALGVMNSRVYWFPHLVITGILGTVFGLTFRRAQAGVTKVSSAACGALIVALAASQTVQSLSPFVKAMTFTRYAVGQVMDSCACADLDNGQVAGLPVNYGGVNAFTEKVWLDYNAHRAGLRACRASDSRCSLRFESTSDGDTLIVLRASRAIPSHRN